MKLLLIGLAAASLYAADQKLGEPLTLKAPVTIDELLAKPAGYVGKTVQVKGKITEVCQAMGCWMSLVSEQGKLLRIQVGHDGKIVFPQEGVGKMAIAEGKLEKSVMSEEEAIAHAKHVAEEQGRKFDPKSVKGGMVTYEIAGTGAVILSN